MAVPETVLEDYAFHTARVASGRQWPVLAILLADFRMTTQYVVVAACAPESPAINTDAIHARFRSFILILLMNIRIAQKIGWREFVAQGHFLHTRVTNKERVNYNLVTIPSRFCRTTVERRLPVR